MPAGAVDLARRCVDTWRPQIFTVVFAGRGHTLSRMVHDSPQNYLPEAGVRPQFLDPPRYSAATRRQFVPAPRVEAAMAKCELKAHI